MSATPASPNQPLVTLWVVQMIGTIIIAGVVIVFFKSTNAVIQGVDKAWALYALYAMVACVIPPILYLRNFKHVYEVDKAAMQRNAGVPDPQIRFVLARALRVGGALSELPQAMGVIHVLLGGEMRWFYGATLITIALRLSYRPFERLR